MNKHKGYAIRSIKDAKKSKKIKKFYILILLILILGLVCVTFFQKKNSSMYIEESSIDSSLGNLDKYQEMIQNSVLDQQKYPELMWSPGKINSSCDNLVKFIKARLEMCAKYGPTITSTFTEGMTSNIYLKEMLNRGYLDYALSEIKKGEYILSNNKKPFKITVLGDVHLNALEKSKSVSEVSLKQKKHISYINNSKCSLVFAEGIDFEVNYDNWTKSMNDAVRKENRRSLTDQELISIIDPNKVWWNEYLLHKPRKNLNIFGVDYIPAIGQFVMILTTQMNACEQNKLRGMIGNTIQGINYELREYLILYKCIEEMLERQEYSSILVIGDSHISTLQKKCKILGIQMDVPERY